MTLVSATAISTWILMPVMDAMDVGGFLLESTIAVVGGAAVGFIAAWFLRRQGRHST
jgi:NhaP-type Na+/H+ or K+/H+ antiporter